VYCSMATIRQDTVIGEFNSYARGSMRPHIYHGHLLPQSSIMIPREALLAIGGHSEELVSCVDHDIWFKMARAGFSMDYVPEPLVRTFVGSDEPRMTSRLDKRLAGISQFFHKWRPILVEQEGWTAWHKIEEIYYRQFTSKVISARQSDRIGRQKALVYLKDFARLQTQWFSWADYLLLALGGGQLIPIRRHAKRLLYAIYTKRKSNK